MRLEPTTEISENYNHLFAIRWIGKEQPHNNDQSSIGNINNIGDKYVIRIFPQRPAEAFTWNEQDLSFEQDQAFQFQVDHIMSGWVWKDFIITTKFQFPLPEILVCNESGKLLHSWNASQLFFVWNNYLVDIMYEPWEKKQTPITLKAVKTAVIWNKKLLICYKDDTAHVLESKLMRECTIDEMHSDLVANRKIAVACLAKE